PVPPVIAIRMVSLVREPHRHAAERAKGHLWVRSNFVLGDEGRSKSGRQHGEHDFRLHEGEVEAHALMWPTTEWEVRKPFVAGRDTVLEPLRPENVGRRPEGRIPMRHPRARDDVPTARNAAAA